MHLKQFAKLGLSFLRHPVYTAYALARQYNHDAPKLELCIRRGADWLLRSQRKSPDGNGYSRSYSLLKGWDRGYIETTGYIIPTLLDVSSFLSEEKYRNSAVRASEWLLNVQTADGAFTDIDTYRPQIFDTGQVMLGLNRMFRETDDVRFLKSARKAGQWLVNNQESDGSWMRFAYNDRPHAYYSRVAAALIETGILCEADNFVDAGRHNLEWVLAQHQNNGYFRYSEFAPGEDAILHTIVYVLEGFSMAFDLTGENRWAETLNRGASALKRLVNEKGLLYSHYDDRWQPTKREFCITGLAQYAGICIDIFKINRDVEFLELSEGLIDRLRRWQMSWGSNIAGALPSSIPVWGSYGGMDFYNWNVKFFLDAMLKHYTVSRKTLGLGE
jgi:hypothetical protein